MEGTVVRTGLIPRGRVPLQATYPVTYLLA